MTGERLLPGTIWAALEFDARGKNKIPASSAALGGESRAGEGGLCVPGRALRAHEDPPRAWGLGFAHHSPSQLQGRHYKG